MKETIKDSTPLPLSLGALDFCQTHNLVIAHTAVSMNPAITAVTRSVSSATDSALAKVVGSLRATTTRMVMKVTGATTTVEMDGIEPATTYSRNAKPTPLPTRATTSMMNIAL
jgi:hypothetical protein